MKMRPLAAAPAVAPQQGPPYDPIKAACVIAWESGLPTRLELPGPLASKRAGLFVSRVRGGSVARAADVLPSGAIRSDGREDLLAQIKVDTRIIAVTDPSGRVISLSALCEPTASAPKPQARAPLADDVDELMQRSASIDHISTADRTIEVLAVPYGQETQVYWRDQWWTEVFEFGAFTDYIRAGVLPRVNREHTKGDTVGKVIELRESPQGLIARIRIAKTERGTETLHLAAEDMLSASIGFSSLEPGGRTVDHQRRHIRIRRAKLDHLSLVESPAYEAARVLAVN
jgi:HK97 family phage prohead protease